MKDYLFEYEEVSVYACAMHLISPHLKRDSIHLDIGCGEGAISSKIKESGATYIGLDLNLEAVSRLIGKGFEAHKIDLSQVDSAIDVIDRITVGRSICSISMLDVIEHLPHENNFLHQLSEWLLAHHPDAKLVTSIPNFSHTDICLRLMGGRWDYTESGLLDKTHHNVLTHSSIHSLLEGAGWISIGHNNYELTISDQKSVMPRMYAANSEMGIGKQLRGIKTLIDLNHQVHQFVTLWTPGYSAVPAYSPTCATNFVSDAIDRTSLGGDDSANGVQTIYLHEIPEHVIPWSNASSEYVIFTQNDDLAGHPILSLIKSVAESNERPVLIIDSESYQRSANPFNVNIAPGPWIAIPALFVKHHLKDIHPRELTPDYWQRFIIMAMIICGIKIETSAEPVKNKGLPFFSSHPTLTLSEVHQRGELESMIASIWPNSNELRDWLCLPERLKIATLHKERAELSSYVAHLESDIQKTTETCRRFRVDLDEILEDRNRIQAELTSKIDLLEKKYQDVKKDLNETQTSRDLIQSELLHTHQYRADLESISAQKRRMEASISWKITAPLRWLNRTQRNK